MKRFLNAVNTLGLIALAQLPLGGISFMAHANLQDAKDLTRKGNGPNLNSIPKNILFKEGQVLASLEEAYDHFLVEMAFTDSHESEVLFRNLIDDLQLRGFIKFNAASVGRIAPSTIL